MRRLRRPAAKALRALALVAALTCVAAPAQAPLAQLVPPREVAGGATLFSTGFAENRHPRTLIGVTPDSFIWLVAVDGRQPQLSAGMTLKELQSFARRLGLTDALNLDGGGSTTMWVTGAVVNSPSDASGPRKVSDALLVFPH